MVRSKKFAVWFGLIVLLSSPALVNAQAPSKSIKIPDATLVPLSLQDALSSATNKVNDPVHFRVTADVKVGQAVAIPKGATAIGHVVEAKSKSILGRSGKLNFTVDYVKAPDGTNVRLRASSARTGEESPGSLLTVPFSLILGGKDVTIPKGTQFSSYVDEDQQITLSAPAPAREAPPAVEPAASSPARPSPPQEPSTVIVKSNPDGADIRVDGKYVGSTPSTLRLVPGDHSVVIEKSGYRQWQRTMSVSAGGIITVDAQLEAQ
jgi:PEGA domain